MKHLLRDILLKRREEHKKAEEESKAVVEKVLSLPQLKTARYVLLYYPHRNEVNTLPLIEKLLKLEKTVLLPKVSGKDILPIPVKELTSLKEGYAGIKEPEGNPVPYEVIDIIFVPGVVFDKKGHRIGYGKGYYDRFLKKVKGLKVGLAYDFQIVDEIPHEEHDIPLDVIITPTRVIKIKEAKEND